MLLLDALRIVQDRDGEIRLAKEVNDIINLMFWLDEKKLLDRLHTFATVRIARLEDRDMLLLLNKMNKMQEELTEVREFVRLCKPIKEVKCRQ